MKHWTVGWEMMVFGLNDREEEVKIVCGVLFLVVFVIQFREFGELIEIVVVWGIWCCVGL